MIRCTYIASDTVIRPAAIGQCTLAQGHTGHHVIQYPTITTSK